MSLVNKIELVNNVLTIFFAMISFAAISPSFLEDRRVISKALCLRLMVIMITETAVMLTAGKDIRGVQIINLVICTFNMLFNMVTTGLVAHYAYKNNEYKISKSYKKDVLMLSIPIIIGCIFLIINLFTGTVFTVDSQGYYIRNSGAFIINGIMILYTLVTISMVLLGKNKERNYLFAPIILVVIPIITGILIRSFIIPQVPVGVLGGSIALLIFVISTRHAERCFDPLTMAYNNEYFPHYLKRIDRDPQARVAGIMIYVEDFKEICIKHGNEAGDDVILKTAKLITDMEISHSALIRSQYDEFILLLSISNLETLKEVLLNIRERVLQYEKDSDDPYKLSLSMATTVYIPREYPGSFVRRMTEQMNPQRKYSEAIAD